MKKMDMVWIVVAESIHSSADATNLVKYKEIEKQVKKHFKEEVDKDLLEKQLVSWIDAKSKDKKSSLRYLFRTSDGLNPSDDGDFRLYKQSDGNYDGKGKDGNVCPDKDDVSSQYHHLITWYEEVYYPSE